MFHIVILGGILADSYGVLPDRIPRAYIRPKKPATTRARLPRQIQGRVLPHSERMAHRVV
jgi:hypothetical protein